MAFKDINNPWVFKAPGAGALGRANRSTEYPTPKGQRGRFSHLLSSRYRVPCRSQHQGNKDDDTP